ncbi:hypothetical protein TWF694_011039 [Orbilia ellipsospora]|uniref:Uncharacterized protein n=1 Tax=Orbilia ellipsospora TaxID=2528407 RepID=A0AAV9X7U7_9PEZI
MSGPLRQQLHRAALASPLASCRLHILHQKRHARVLNGLQFAHPVNNNIADKYKHLLEKKAKSEGLESVDDLKQAYKHRIDQYKRDSIAPPKLPDSLHHDGTTPTPSSSSSSTILSTPPPIPKSSTSPPSIPKSSAQKSLDSYLDISKILLHDPKEIEYIWRARHISDANSLCAVIPHQTYLRLAKTAKSHPMFILPLPRPDQGIELHFLQWQFSSPTTVNVMFTSLIEYKLRGEFASPHTTVTHHLDICEEKGIVLLQGSVVENKGVSVEEAKWLLMALQKFYAAEEGVEGAGEEVARRKLLLKQFSEGKADFDVQALIREVETIN